MKKGLLMMLGLISLLVFLCAAPVSATPLPGLDCLIDVGDKDALGGNSNPLSEYNWLNGLLEGSLPAYGEGGIGLIKFEDPIISSEGNEIIFDVGGPWNYAVIKAGQLWYAVANCTYDNFLVVSTEDISKVISHISFVPEPSTMLLLGFGLIGMAAFGRRKLFKKG